MKPHELVLDGFMAYTGNTTLDFRELDLFAIVGPTGSGKSALLDAMTFALYGRTPRLGATRLEQLISQGGIGTSVSLTFEVRGELYRVARSKGVKASGDQLRLEQQVNERWLGLNGQSKAETESRIQEVVGLDFQTFTTAVMLPQGEFATFLRGSKTVRQNLLGDLLGLGQVDQMQRYASDRHKEFGTRLDSLNKRLDGEYGEVSAAWLADLEAQRARVTEGVRVLRERRDDLGSRLGILRALDSDHRALNAARTALAALDARAAEVTAGLSRAALARRVAGVAPLMQASSRAAEAAMRASTALTTAQERHAAARRQGQAAALSVSAAAQELAALPELEAQAEALRGAEADARTLKMLGGRPELTHPQPLDWDPEAHHAAAEAARRLGELRQEEANLKVMRSGHDAQRLAHDTEDSLIRQEQTRLERIKSDGQTLKGQCEAAERDYQEARDRLGLDAYRAHLHLGEACPLCQQTVAELPPLGSSDVTALKERRDALQTQLEARREEYRQLAPRLDHRSKVLAQARHDLLDAVAAREDRQKALEAGLARISGQPDEEARQYLAGLARRVTRAGADPARRRAALLARHEALRRADAEARTAQATAGAQHAAAAERLSDAVQEAGQRQQEAQTTRAELDAGLRELGVSEQEAAAARLSESEIRALETAGERHTQARQGHAAEVQRLSLRLGGAPHDPAALSAAERELVALDHEYAEAERQAGALGQQVATGQGRLARREELETQARALATQVDTWKTLSGHLGAQRFKAYLMEEIEGRLLAQAGTLLYEMSDERYRLHLHDGEYAVQDLQNAGETRAVKTLSGGETFLASLALAVALSDELAGNRSLGALFLDEGFGTLDPAALDFVATALSTLRHKGRMVGVITHVEALSRQMPAQVMVSKGVGGSRLVRV